MLAGVGPGGTSTCLGVGAGEDAGSTLGLISSLGSICSFGGLAARSGGVGITLGADDWLPGGLFCASGLAVAGLESLVKNATMAPKTSATPPTAAAVTHGSLEAEDLRLRGTA